LSSYLTLFSLAPRPPPCPTLFPYTTLFRSLRLQPRRFDVRVQPERGRIRTLHVAGRRGGIARVEQLRGPRDRPERDHGSDGRDRSEEHTSELQSRFDLVCRLLLEKKKKKNQ